MPRNIVGLLLLFLGLPALVAGAPVDTLQFGNLRSGMHETEVLRRLGPPDAVAEHTEQVCVRTAPGINRCHPIAVTVWTYGGGGTMMDTHLLFRNRVLHQKDKRR